MLAEEEEDAEATKSEEGCELLNEGAESDVRCPAVLLPKPVAEAPVSFCVCLAICSSRAFRLAVSFASRSLFCNIRQRDCDTHE